jgi:tetratricopeptide (TPR) repeat protein
VKSFLLIAFIVTLGAGPAGAAPGDANDRGVEYLKQGKVAQAIPELQTAVEQNPKDTASRMNLAYAYEREGRLDEAIYHYEKVLSLKPQDAIARNNLGVLYDRQGRYDQAIGEFQAAMETDPKSATAPKNLETARKNQAAAQERERQIAEALRNAEANPENPTASYNLARLYAFYGKKEQAIGWLEKALKLGFNDVAYLKVDSALESLRDDPSYIWLLRGR